MTRNDHPAEHTEDAAFICADNPITKLEEDVLGRLKPAELFAKQILSIDHREGAVVGVLGPWGSGKTSFINLSKTFLKEPSATIIEFNPWMFSGADQLVEFFFIELSAQLRLWPDLAEIGKGFEILGDVFSAFDWLPVAGSFLKEGRSMTNLISKTLQYKKNGIKGKRDKLRNALQKIKKPIIVILDDIDRLSTSEIREIFKLVRLTANFPNIIYILSFDRKHVEQALAEQGISGRDYLEKILQVAFDLPAIPYVVLTSQTSKAIEAALSNIKNLEDVNRNVWPDVFMEVIRPLIKNMRDVRRYTMAIHGTVDALEGQVALADVLGLEAIRVFLPDVFQRLHDSVNALTDTSDSDISPETSSKLKKKIEDLVDAGKNHAECIRNLIYRLFPAGKRHLGNWRYGAEWKNTWLRERRVAHECKLLYYLERFESEELQILSYAGIAFVKIADKAAFESYLQSLPIERLQDVILSLEVYESEFKAEQIVPATTVLLNLLPKLPEKQLGMFELNASVSVGRVVFRLVRTLNDPEVTEEKVQEILPQIHSLSSKYVLITIIGHREGRGHQLVSESAAQRFEADWRAEVRAASVETLADENLLFDILSATKKEAAENEPVLVIPDTPGVTYALLKSTRRNATSQTHGNRAISRETRLAWDNLIELYGSEDILRDRIEKLRANPPANITPTNIGGLLALADKYLAGWRPEKVAPI